MDGGNEGWEVHTSGNARPSVNAAITFCKSKPTFIRFSSVEALLEAKEFKVCPGFDVTVWRARLSINA